MRVLLHLQNVEKLVLVGMGGDFKFEINTA